MTFCGYDNRVRVKYTAKRNVQITGMIFRTRLQSVPPKGFLQDVRCNLRYITVLSHTP
ncbi:MAG: DUF6783 domain-containing protein [Ruminococcus sp.]